jgi:AraC family transcriptional regulator
MFTDALPTNPTSSRKARNLQIPRAILPLPIERRGGFPYDERADHNSTRQTYRDEMTDRVGPAVEISPSHNVKRRAATWPGMAAEVVQAIRHDRIESRFCAPVHLLVLYERGQRYDGSTFIEGLPKSTLHDLRRKLTLVPAGHRYHDCQEPHILTRVIYFYFDPAKLGAGLGLGSMSLAPRLFFENNELWDTAIKLMSLIEGADQDHQLYLEALGVVLAHELMRFNAGKPSMEPQVRGGLAAWQQRTIIAYIEEHLAEPISLASLAKLVRLSPYHFCRAFKQSFGVPPHRYHASQRIERAKMLLAAGGPSVTDIGFTLGFNQTSSFTSAFHKATGLTPTAYRRS